MLTERALESFKQFVETNIAYAINKRTLKRRQGSVEYFHYPGGVGDHDNYKDTVVRYG